MKRIFYLMIVKIRQIREKNPSIQNITILIKKKCFIQTAVYQKNNNISHNNGNLNQNYSTLEKLAYECEIYEKTIQPETFKKRVNELFSNNEMKSSIIENNYKEDGEYDIIGS